MVNFGGVWYYFSLDIIIRMNTLYRIVVRAHCGEFRCQQLGKAKLPCCLLCLQRLDYV